MQVGSATFIIRVIKHSGICSGDSKILQVASRFQDVKTSHVTSAFCFCSPCLHAYCSIFYQLLVFPGCQDISCDISFLLPLSSCSYCCEAVHCSIFYQLLVFSRMSRHLMWHQLSAPPVSMLLLLWSSSLRHLLSATSFSSLHQSSSAAVV